jgi:N4-gp56 family major capsid protein
MALTNFANMTTEQLTIWQRRVWTQARNNQFINRFVGDGPNSMIQRITELKKTTKGARAVITLLADLVGDGVAGDRQLEGNEEAMKTFDQVIRVDQLRHAVRHEGKMADQKSVVEFRGNAKDQLSIWLADRHDQLAMLTLSGVPYSVYCNGAPRIGSDLPNLEYAQDVSTITANRRLRWDKGTNSLVANASTGDVAAEDTPCWEMFIQAKAYAKTHKIRGRKVGGKEVFDVFLSPLAMAKLKMDPLYNTQIQQAQKAGADNPLFTGDAVHIDGLMIHDYEHVYNTSGASGSVLIPRGGPLNSKWGATGTIDGCQILFCGAQAMGFADLGNAEWNEEGFDYQNSQGIEVGKISGLLNPKFMSPVTGSVENHGMMSIYVAQ